MFNNQQILEILDILETTLKSEQFDFYFNDNQSEIPNDLPEKVLCYEVAKQLLGKG